MGHDDVASALQAMTTDAEVAERLAGGDFTDLPDAALTEAERAMVIAAANDLPEVAGFGVYAKYDGVDGEVAPKPPKIDAALKSPFDVAVDYTGLEFRPREP